MSVPRVLNGRYEIVELLGRGGMADVYLARDTLLGRMVAVKLLRGDVARDTQLQARFRREAQAVAGLNHPSIVGVYDTGQHANGDDPRDDAALPYMVMEYVHGKTLRTLIRSKTMTIEQAIEFSLGVLSALEYSHRAGIVHRDIKPANVMVTEDESGTLHDVKVMDFGIARTIADSAATMTQTQTVMGTAQYLSPEQARGESVDARSDLYSAACLLYEMLAGRPPFTGDSPVSVAYQHVREVPPAASSFNPEVTPALDSVLLHALNKDKQDRFQDAAAFKRALRQARSGVSMAKPVLPPSSVTEAAPKVPQETAPVAKAAVMPLASPPDQENNDDAPATRAMAKIMAGGALTTGTVEEHEVSEPATRSKRGRTAWTITLFAFLAIILGGGVILGLNLLNAKPPPPVQVSVPNVVGQTEAAAMTDLRALGFNPEREEAYSTTVPEGNVVSTDPRADILVNKNSSIKVVVSKGSSEVTIPKDLAGKTETEVVRLLTDLKLNFLPNQMVDDGQIQANLVVTTDPPPGGTVPVGTSVTLKISNGQVTMPSLFDLTKEADEVQKKVRETLAKVSPLLTVEFATAENSVVAPGMVIKQSESAGSKVPQRTKVMVTLAKAPPKKPTPSPTPSVTPTPSASPTAIDNKDKGNDKGPKPKD